MAISSPSVFSPIQSTLCRLVSNSSGFLFCPEDDYHLCSGLFPCSWTFPLRFTSVLLPLPCHVVSDVSRDLGFACTLVFTNIVPLCHQLHYPPKCRCSPLWLIHKSLVHFPFTPVFTCTRLVEWSSFYYLHHWSHKSW